MIYQQLLDTNNCKTVAIFMRFSLFVEMKCVDCCDADFIHKWTGNAKWLLLYGSLSIIIIAGPRMAIGVRNNGD